MMKPIRMVDLQGQYEKIKTEIDTAIREVISQTSFINGPAVQRFQENLQNYLGVKHVIPCANGTDALQVSMMALNLQPGDEVITTSFTFIATVEVIALLRLTPVLVDVLPDTFNIDPDSIRRAITPKTKAVVPVHLFGQCANMDEIMDIAAEHNLYVIEDACQSIGAVYHGRDGRTRHSGTIGHLGCTSFFPSKNLGCYGDGGAVYTQDEELAAKLRVIVNHGMTVRYYHDMVGVNSRLDSIQAAVLNTKLKYLDQYIVNRQKAAEYYNKALTHPLLVTPVTTNASSHVFHQYTLMVKNGLRDALHQHLNTLSIPNAIYYPVPLHMQKAYIDPRYREGDFPVTEQLCREVLSLPMHTELTEEQQKHITDAILGFLNNN
jgi:UDP-2-acetamido-2-deoxy-ribo-hexuluronate aminotransferase